jgi:hypothetical protein
MKPSTRLSPSLARDATALAHGAQLLCRGAGTPAAWDAFTEALDRTLSRGDPDEFQVLSAATHALAARHDDEARDWLIHEVEMESELQYLPDPKTGRNKACVLFALPIAAPADMALPNSLYANKAFDVLHNILEDAKVLDGQAHFRLLPRLLTAQQLRGRSKSEIRALTRSLGTQLLADRNGVLALEDGVFTAEPPMLEDLSVYEFAHLRYLVGVAVTEDEFLNDLFPELQPPDADTPQEDKPGAAGAREAGWLPDGSWWNQPFCEKLAECLLQVHPDFSVCAPQGFHDDLRIGLELLREQDARLQCALAMDAHSLVEDDVVVEEWPLVTPDGQVVGLGVYLVDAQDTDRVYAAISWPACHHEALDDAIEQLHAMLNTLDLVPADARLSADFGQASYLLH